MAYQVIHSVYCYLRVLLVYYCDFFVVNVVPVCRMYVCEKILQSVQTCLICKDKQDGVRGDLEEVRKW